MNKHTIVCISGKMGSGKTTLAASLVNKYSGTHMKFASPLYEMQEAIRGVLAKYGIEMPKKVGSLLQYLGTEFGRKLFGDDVWVKCIHNAIHDAVLAIEKWDHAFIVVDDARFENELEMFLKMKSIHADWNVVTIRLKADEETRKARADSWRENTSHASEIGLDHREDDFEFVFDTQLYSKEEILSRACRAIDG